MRKNSYLSEKQIKTLKEILLSEKEKLLNANIGRNQECFHLDKNELSDPVDEACINAQTSQQLRFRNREVFYLKKINNALLRIEEGTYGLCDSCDAEISFERLKARCTAELCISCKEESEISEKNNYYDQKSKSLGKTLLELSSRS